MPTIFFDLVQKHMKSDQTPLMRQYNQIKKKYPDTVLLFRLGDFFETFEEDAKITAKVCGITLTKRNNGGSETPLAGFPHHQLDNYLPKLVRAGFRVAVCEQLEDPKHARGIVRRDVVEVVTPGVAINDKLLDTKRNNYLATLALTHAKGGISLAGISCVDVSTGEFFTTEVTFSEIVNVLESLQPAEILICKQHQSETEQFTKKLVSLPSITRLEEWLFDEQFAREQLLQHFGTASLKGFGIAEMTAGIVAAGVALHYISETQKGHLPQIRHISSYNPSEYIALDFATKRNLEITFSMSDASREGTLIHILDKTETAMGGRMFKKWLIRPLRKLKPLEQRLNAVKCLFDDDGLRELLRRELAEVGDIERLMSKICTGRATPRDLVSFKNTLAKIPKIRTLLLDLPSETLKQITQTLTPLPEIFDLLQNSLAEDPPAQVGGGNVFREGFSPELDEIRNAMYSGKSWMANFQESERQKTGIPSLKVGFTNVFGYYIEITNTHKTKIPDYFDRKQTLANAERYTTPELKEMESKILNAEEKIGDLERELFNQLRMKIAESADIAQKNAALLGMIDCFQSFAHAAREYDFCEPKLEESTILDIVGGRHPVVERLLTVGENYTPNSTFLTTDEQQIHIITGPNMSGKSSYLRQVGLIVLLAQIGSFVPAKSAKIGLTDMIFTRVGAQDNITAGESTFLVEMQEAANILNNATAQSLILLDEVGRGTSTFDGISIAWAIAEFIHEKIGARTLFATHYHELNELAVRFERIHNYKVDVQEIGDKVIFTHRVAAGAADHSFGIYVAEMAGLPVEVTVRAKEIMLALEENSAKEFATETVRHGEPSAKTSRQNVIPDKIAAISQLSMFEVRDDEIRDKIKGLDLNVMSPMQALQTLWELQKVVKG